MSFRFYRCYRVSPGLHVNFSKSGLSLTMGSGRTSCHVRTARALVVD